MVLCVSQVVQELVKEEEDICDWCGITITEELKDDAFNCVYRHCDKMLCGLKGCSRNVAYFSCCEKCEEQEQACDDSDEDDSDEDDADQDAGEPSSPPPCGDHRQPFC